MLSQVINVVLLLIPPMIFAIYGSMKEPNSSHVQRSAEFYNPQPKDHVFFSAKNDAVIEPIENEKKAPCNIRYGERLMIDKNDLNQPKSNSEVHEFQGRLTIQRLDGVIVRCSLSKGKFSKNDFVQF